MSSPRKFGPYASEEYLFEAFQLMKAMVEELYYERGQQKLSKVEEEVKELPSTPNSEIISEVCSEGHSSISPCSHQDGSFGAFEKHTKGVGLKLLTKVGYEEGKGLGIEGQGIIDPIEVVERPRYFELGYGKVEL